MTVSRPRRIRNALRSTGGGVSEPLAAPALPRRATDGRAVSVAAAAIALTGCDGAQSTLAPAGRGAEQVAELFWWMAGGAAVIWVAVIALAIYASRVHPESYSRRAGFFIIGGGAVIPTIVLTVLLVYGLAILPGLLAPAPPGSLEISVTGEQWWWRVRYAGPDGEVTETANTIHLPVGQPVQFHLNSADVIHSFWIPSLGGKMDMFPGRTTRLTLHPTRTGVYRGACAEYCGESHALMNFDVVVQDQESFQRWLRRQRAAAAEPSESLAERGREVFFTSGCGACHTIRGSGADGVVGPDLTHVGSRRSLGAGVLPNETEAFRRWIGHTEQVKPGVIMPSFDMLPPEDLRALAAYLDALR